MHRASPTSLHRHPHLFFLPIALNSLGQDDRLTGCWRSSELWLLVPLESGRWPGLIPTTPGCPSPQRRETSPQGGLVPVSVETRRWAGHGSDSHLSGQRLWVSKETYRPSSSHTQPPHPQYICVVFCNTSTSTLWNASPPVRPPCHGSATPVRPAGNSGKMWDETCESGQGLGGDPRTGTAHTFSGSRSIMFVSGCVKQSFPKANSLKMFFFCALLHCV